MWFIQYGRMKADEKIVAVPTRKELWAWMQQYKDQYDELPECLRIYKAKRILDWT